MASRMYVYFIDSSLTGTERLCSRDAGVCLAMVQFCERSLTPTYTCHHVTILLTYLQRYFSMTMPLRWEKKLTYSGSNLNDRGLLSFSLSTNTLRFWTTFSYLHTHFCSCLVVYVYFFWLSVLSPNDSVYDYRCKHWTLHAVRLLTPYQMQVCHNMW